jgi:hypothetical protein
MIPSAFTTFYFIAEPLLTPVKLRGHQKILSEYNHHNNGVNSAFLSTIAGMMDAAKVADFVLLMIDGSFSFTPSGLRPEPLL